MKLIKRNALIHSYHQIFEVGPSIVTLNERKKFFCKGDTQDIAMLLTAWFKGISDQYDTKDLLARISENLETGKKIDGEVYGIMTIYND